MATGPPAVPPAGQGRPHLYDAPDGNQPGGTLRWPDLSLLVPDPRQIWQYGVIQETTVEQYALMNVDSIGFAALPDTGSDR